MPNTSRRRRTTAVSLAPGEIVTVFGAPVTVAIAGDAIITVNDATVVEADTLPATA